MIDILQRNKGMAAWLLAFALLFSVSSLKAQVEEIGGPYEPDTNTVLLMHFDGNLDNEVEGTASPVQHGNVGFIQNPVRPELNQMLRLDNDARTDSSYITLPDTSNLDLTGSWTMETWVNVFTYGDDSDDWRWQPRLMFKPGDDAPYFSNYFFNLFGGDRRFNTGYYTDAGDGWISANSPNNFMQAGQWYHLTFIRDTTKKVVVQLIHEPVTEDSLELVNFTSEGYDPETGAPPLTNSNPLYIGTSPQNNFGTMFLDGFMDELRISNVVRNFPVPPVITNVSDPGTQPADSSYDITAQITTLGDPTITNPQLHWRVNEGSWTTLPMSNVEGDQYSATIPAQNIGDNVEYYLSAETSTGLTASSPSNAVRDTSFYSFGIASENSKLLHLSFEEDSGVPVDSSQYGNVADTVGNISYEEGMVGNAISFDGDSSYVSFDSPYLGSEEFTVDFWFMARDSLPATNTRIWVKEGGGSWFEVNHQFWFDTGGNMVTASYVPEQEDDSFIGSFLTTDTTITADEWYHVVYTYDMEDSLAISQLRNAQDSVIDQKTLELQGPANATTGPLYIGGTPSNDQYFNGMVDEVRLYNYVPEEYQDIMVDTTTTDIEEDRTALPEQVTLSENYPNPFNPTTRINYSLPQAGDVQLKVYNMLGREVATLVDGRKASGRHEIEFNARDLASGMYFYRLQADNTTITRKMLLVK